VSAAWAIACGIAGYLIGSVPFGLLLTRLAGLGDIRAIGSGSIGATNVLRTGSKGLAGLTVLLDLAKGTAAVLIGFHWGEMGAIAGGGAAILGHMFPVWLRFRGGKGVATALGVLIVIAWPVALGASALWLITALIFHYSSLAALVAAVASAGLAGLAVIQNRVVLAGFVVDHDRAILIAAIAILVVIRHRDNIHRLLAGTEGRISLRKG